MKRIVKSPWILCFLVLIIVILVAFNIPIEKRKYGLAQSGMTTDYTGLLPEHVDRVVKATNRTDLQNIVKQANLEGKHISIAGLQHSQGGHTYYKDGIVIDMRTINKVMEVNKQEKTVRVEAGASWEDVQKAVQPYGLALKVTQSQSIFTIGGSLSVNAHGRDIRFGPMADMVKEITLLTPKGDIKTIRKNDALMGYVLGGYGLFGVILDVTLDLTDNELYTIHTNKMKTSEYESYFKDVQSNAEIAMHYARVSVAPSSFLDEMYAIDYYKTGKYDQKTKLKEESFVHLTKYSLDMGRQGGFLEDLFWNTQNLYMKQIENSQITRNNVMRSESTFMEFTKPGKVEVLQEFFVPVGEYGEYMKDLKQFLPANDADDDFKIHNITIRYAAKDKTTSLNYAKEDMLGLVILIQHGLQEENIQNAKKIIQKWTDITLAHGGTYYLPYYPYQTKKQFKESYTNWKDFKDQKLKLDPNEVFINNFYQNYLK
ncbi:FAD-binding oxidoreductase [uncultured Rummeliibacillus sp.]|uniref:FAD-binding oxidoreductase n=1 Tax=uncultured Rummeliibacillus sp. TaxID=762292 RepID=UPI00262897CC|nr:FAD-binding oxidoreductase [uncultured Rummeliibacillus sp.]